MMERCGSLETKINYVENNTNEKITQLERESKKQKKEGKEERNATT